MKSEPPSQPSPFRRAGYILIILGLCLGGVWLFREESVGRKPSSHTAAQAGNALRQETGETTDLAPSTAPAAEPSTDWQNLARHVSALPAEERSAHLQDWWARRGESQLSPAQAGADLLRFLQSGLDADLGLVFRVAPGGILASAPTLRVQALDWLGAVDPEAAARYALEVFAESASPDEWAVSLRNYGRRLEDPSRDGLYISTLQRMIAHPEWQARPTGGFLEGFDAAVHCGSPKLLPVLWETAAQAPHRGTRMAAIMTLETMARREPAAVAAAIHGPDNPSSNLPGLRASLMARLDPANDAQAEILQHYFLNEDLPAAERAAFVRVFPNHNAFAGHRLLTQSAPQAIARMAWQDREALHRVREWQSDPRFAPHAGYLAELESRLAAFVESAVRGGILAMEDSP